MTTGGARSFGRILGLIVLAGVVATLAGCGGGGGGGTSPAAPQGPPLQQPPPPPAPSAPADPILYLAAEDDPNLFELYLVDPTAPGVPEKVNAPLASGGDVGPYGLHPDATHAAYIAIENSSSARELYLVDLAAPGQSTKLNAPLAAGGQVLAFTFDPDGSHVAYLANQDDVTLAELYVVDVTNPGLSTKLNPALLPSGGVTFGFSFNSEGTQVLYAADQDIDSVFELYVVDVAAPGAATKVNPPFAASTDLANGFRFSPDGATIGYMADQEADGVRELFAVATSELGTSTKLNGPLVAAGDACAFRFSPDSKHVAYCADQDTDDVIELYLVDVAVPGVSLKLNSPLVADGDVSAESYLFAPDSSFVVYRADQDIDGQFDLYRAELAMPATTFKLNAPLVAGGDVPPAAYTPAFRVSADGSRFIYIADQETDGVFELYTVDLATPGVAAKLSPPMSFDGVLQFEPTADGAQIVYQALQDGVQPELYRLDVASPGSSTRMNGALPPDGIVLDFSIVPGVRVP